MRRPRIRQPDVLPADVLYEVLLRLPANVLCRLRLVCRSWRLLTSDPSFARAHSSRQPLIAGLHAEREEVHIADLSGNIIKRIHISSSSFSDDLNTHLDTICVSVSRFQNQKGFVRRHRQAGGEEVITLPEFICFCPSSILAHVPSTGDYKVLRVARQFRNHGFVQESYVTTLDGGGGAAGWRRTRPHLEVPVEPGFRHRAVFGGVAYFLLGVFWKYYDYSGPNFADMEPDSVASFDLEKEEWRTTTIRGPVSSLLAMAGDKLGYMDNRLRFQLTELSGSLAMVHSKFEERVVGIWSMVDLGRGAWSKRYSLDCASDPVDCRFLYPIAVLGDGRIVAWMYDRAMRIYDPRTSSWTSAMVTGEKYVAVGMYGGNFLCS